MQSLFKSRKKRESHAKATEEGNTGNHEGNQRSPSGSSAKSTESPLKSAQNALGANKGSQLGGIVGAANGAPASLTNAVSNLQNDTSSAVDNATSHLPQGMQHQVQQRAESVQKEASKMLNSPFLGTNQQGQSQDNLQNNFGNHQHMGHQAPQDLSQGNPKYFPQGQQRGTMQGSNISGNTPGSSYQPIDKLSPQGQPQPPHGQFGGTYTSSPQYGGQTPHYNTAKMPGQPVGGFNRASQDPSAPQSGQYPGASPITGGNGHRQSGSVGSGVSTPGSHAGFSPQPRSAAFASPLNQASETPWAEYNVQRAAPSPRFGHSANYIAARDGELFIMGGIRDMDILNDLWVIDTNTLTGYQLVTEGYKVGPRVGHASLVLGNAHVVFGGDTKIEESDPLDDNLYLLNTSSLKWTVAQPHGPRPSGRYGHSLSNVGARVYVFGGQVDEEFYDDMWAFDLTNWRSTSARWEKIQPTTPPPPPRTNHTVVTHKDKLYLFGGANGDLWYSDTWCFDPITRAWEQLECSGYVPAPCQGHAATIIDDVMYVFGGMSSQGVLIDQLFALKLTTLKWYTFQNLGPGPSPRSGHSLTSFGGDKILVWGGTDQGNSAYVLDVSRINYPEDQQVGPSSANMTQTPLSVQEHPEHESPSRGSDTHESGASVAALGAAGTGAAAAASAAAAATASGNHTSPQEPTEKHVESSPVHYAQDSSRNSSITTTKEVRELQPHIYAPQSSENSGPTQARSNSAARNSMLFSKRRSVLMSSSPVKDVKSREDKGIQGKHTEFREEDAQGPRLDHSVGSDTRSPNRQSAQVKSYVTEGDGEMPDERFVSAVDLQDGAKNGNNQEPFRDIPRSRGHSRGLSLGTSSEEPPTSGDEHHQQSHTTDNDRQFRKLERELNGMPGGLVGTFPNSTTSSLDAIPAGGAHVEGLASSDSIKSGLPGWNNAKGTEESSSADDRSGSKGLRRSQPQTNLSLQSIESEDHLPSQSADSSKHEANESALSAGSTNVASAYDHHTIGEPLGSNGLSSHNSSDPHRETYNEVTTSHVSNSHSHEKDPPSHEASLTQSARNNSDDFAHSTEIQPVSKDAATLEPRVGDQKSLQSRNILSPVVNGAREPVVDNFTLSPTGPTSNESGLASRGARDVKDIEKRGPLGAGNDTGISGASAIDADVAGAGVAGSGVAGINAEISRLRRELDSYRQRDLDSEHHQLKQAHAQAQRELSNLKDATGQLQRKHVSVTGQNDDLRRRYDQIEKVMDGHIATIKAQQAALEEAEATIKGQREKLAELAPLKAENSDLRMKLKVAESAQKHAEEQLAAINNSYATLKSAHSDLNAKHLAFTSGTSSKDSDAVDPRAELDTHVRSLIQIWDQFKLPAVVDSTGTTTGTRDLAGNEERGGYRDLYETQKNAADQAQRQLNDAYHEQSELKRQLRELSAAYSASPSAADIDALKEQHQSALSSLAEKHSALQEKHQLNLKTLDEHRASLEDLRQRLRSLETAHSELQSEYKKAVDLSRNQQAALTKTREELNVSRAQVHRLEEQLEDITVQNSSLHAEHNSSVVEGDMSHASVTSSRNDQAALVIGDLRAQVVILEEELQNQRNLVMELKKAALTH